MKMNWPESMFSLAIIALSGVMCWLFNSPWYLFLLILIFSKGERHEKERKPGNG